MTLNDRADIVELARRQHAGLDPMADRCARCHVWILGDIAVALAGCETVGDRPTKEHEVSAYLLTRTPEGRRVAARNRDTVGDIDQAFAAMGL